MSGEESSLGGGGDMEGNRHVPILNIPNPQLNSSGEVPMEEDDDFQNVSGDEPKSGKLTLTALLQEGLVEAGEGVMSIDYLGQTFKGDLLACGKIKSQETGLIFNNPSAWAISCKKIINPAKKSGCGEYKVKTMANLLASKAK